MLVIQTECARLSKKASKQGRKGRRGQPQFKSAGNIVLDLTKVNGLAVCWVTNRNVIYDDAPEEWAKGRSLVDEWQTGNGSNCSARVSAESLT